MASQAAGRVDETRRILRSLRWRAPLRALAIRGILHATQRSIAFRERARVKQALLYSRCRRIALAIGRRLVAAGQLQETNEVFMLTWSEITDVAAGREIFAEGLAGGIARRQHQHATRAALNPPDRIVLPAGAVYSAEPATVAPGGTRADPPGAHGDEPYPATLSGISACGGRSRAHAAVLTDVTESSKLRRGDILVTRQTDPGWGPIFGLVSGLVIERGGMLSHGAIIAREFGLPCVVGIAGASRIIPHRAMLTVDGDAGTCTIERPAPATEVRL